MKKLKAFTLVELVVSLALTAVIIGSVGTFLYFSLSMNGLLREQDRDYDVASDIAYMIREYANSETGKTYSQELATNENEVLLFNTPTKDYVYDNEAYDLVRIEEENRTVLYNGKDGYGLTSSFDAGNRVVEYTISFGNSPVLRFSVFLNQ